MPRPGHDQRGDHPRCHGDRQERQVVGVETGIIPRQGGQQREPRQRAGLHAQNTDGGAVPDREPRPEQVRRRPQQRVRQHREAQQQHAAGVTGPARPAVLGKMRDERPGQRRGTTGDERRSSAPAGPARGRNPPRQNAEPGDGAPPRSRRHQRPEQHRERHRLRRVGMHIAGRRRHGHERGRQAVAGGSPEGGVGDLHRPRHRRRSGVPEHEDQQRGEPERRHRHPPRRHVERDVVPQQPKLPRHPQRPEDSRRVRRRDQPHHHAHRGSDEPGHGSRESRVDPGPSSQPQVAPMGPVPRRGERLAPLGGQVAKRFSHPRQLGLCDRTRVAGLSCLSGTGSGQLLGDPVTPVDGADRITDAQPTRRTGTR